MVQVTHTGVELQQELVGSAVRQDGRSVSMTAPNGQAQQRMLKVLMKDACVRPDQLLVVESAANGSKLGDSIETGAIAAAFLMDRVESTHQLAVQSVKGNVGCATLMCAVPSASHCIHPPGLYTLSVFMLVAVLCVGALHAHIPCGVRQARCNP